MGKMSFVYSVFVGELSDCASMLRGISRHTYPQSSVMSFIIYHTNSSVQ